MKNSSKIVILSVALLGAMLLAGLGFLGLLVQIAVHEGTVEDIEDRFVDEDFEEASMIAEMQYEESFGNAEIARANTPSEREQPLQGSYEIPAVPATDGSGEETRSSGDLLSEEGFLRPDEGPEAPSVDMEETIGKLNGNGGILESVGTWVEEGKPPEDVEVPSLDQDVLIPVSEDGVLIDPSKLDIDAEMHDINADLNEHVGDLLPGEFQAGLFEETLASTIWTSSNRTTTDTDGDGNPESIYEVKVAVSETNGTIPNSTLIKVMGIEYVYEDEDSDGVPRYEETTLIRYFNLTVNGKRIAEGVAYSNVVKNDTNSDGVVDRIEVRHLSYGYLSLPPGVRSFAVAGELILVDTDGDGTYDDREGTAILFYRKEIGSVTVRESALIVSGHVTGYSKEMGILCFNRLNSTSGTILLEEGYVLSYHEDEDGRELVIMCGRNDTVEERVQYVIFNGTEEHVVAFAVENSTLEDGTHRSDVVAYDVTFDGEDVTGMLAAGRTDRSDDGLLESFGLISFVRTHEDGVLFYENITVIVGRNLTTDEGLNSTIAYAFREYSDSDGDGISEYLREAHAVSLKIDGDMDGYPELEGYYVASRELVDSDSDGNVELNHTFILMGWKADGDSDGNVEVERALLINVSSRDGNSNGFFEIVEEMTLGIEKEDIDSDGVVDHEKVMVHTRKVTDLYDDGTSINEETNTWSHEN